VDEALASGGVALTIRGGAAAGPRGAALAQRARWVFGEIVVHTHAVELGAPGAAAALRASGATGVLVPLLSQSPVAHDTLAGKPGALVAALVGMRAAASAGLTIDVEIPILPARAQRLEAVVDMAHRAVPGLRSARFHLPRYPVPRGLAPPRLDELEPALAAAIERCRAASIAVELHKRDAIPLCALAGRADLHDAFRFNPKAKAAAGPDCVFVPACERCVVRRQCGGLARTYAEAHGPDDVRPYRRRPARMFDQRKGKRRVWTDDERRAASRAQLVVLRPTVHCNQDCTFCSANETSSNVWTEPGAMLRQIARAARRPGVEVMSFSGGEPTLSRDLPAYVRAARRLGVPIVELVTNGVLLDDERRVRALRDAGLNQAFVSLHAHDERLSQALTQKVGDFERTVKAIQHLVTLGIATTVNHVISSRNYRYLEPFVDLVHRSFRGRVIVSFAFVTPQYKALEDLGQVPRLSDAMPYLRRAMRRAVGLGQAFLVGARQGVPPCLLGEFEAWSDLTRHADEAAAEDAHQKVRSPRCDECRYTRHCTGLWRPYAERYGTDELRPIAGPPLTSADVAALDRALRLDKREVLTSFAQVPPSFRHPELEAEDLGEPAPAGPQHLPVLEPRRSRPLRVALIGSGRAARRLAAAARGVPGLAIDAVASPHAPDGDLRDFGHCPAFRDAREALDAVRPEAVIVAADTRVHAELAALALERGMPVLIERPLTYRLDEAEALVAAARGGRAAAMVAHATLFAEGLAEVLARGRGGAIDYVARGAPDGARAPRAWSKLTLFEALYDAAALLVRAAGEAVTEVLETRFAGDVRPERVTTRARLGVAEASLTLDFTAAADELRVAVTDGAGEVRSWARTGASSRRDQARMLALFRDAALGRATAEPSLEEAARAVKSARALLDALEAAGAPLGRAEAPKHVASRSLARW
jgi:molybdenum cofactor biosynthesis enzyme MoaA/predicted dehydrogenase